MFEGYTIQQAAIVIDTCDEIVEEAVRKGSIPTKRKYLLFGEILLDKNFVDNIAPDVRSFMQRTGGTRADWERKKQERAQIERETEQIEADIEAINEQQRKDQEEFIKQFNALTEAYTKKMLSKLETDQTTSKEKGQAK